jgi:hypothetical protein
MFNAHVVSLRAQPQRYLSSVNVVGGKFGAAQRVHYQSDYPSFLLHAPDVHTKILTIKSSSWDYEKEFRLIGTHDFRVPNNPLLLQTATFILAPVNWRPSSSAAKWTMQPSKEFVR